MEFQVDMDFMVDPISLLQTVCSCIGHLIKKSSFLTELRPTVIFQMVDCYVLVAFVRACLMCAWFMLDACLMRACCVLGVYLLVFNHCFMCLMYVEWGHLFIKYFHLQFCKHSMNMTVFQLYAPVLYVKLVGFEKMILIHILSIDLLICHVPLLTWVYSSNGDDWQANLVFRIYLWYLNIV